jgi:predicted phage-related endonuclease
MLDHKMRQLAIGGSDIGAILGLDDNRDGFSVWAAKRGGLPRLTDDEKPLPMLIGSFLEEGIIRLYTHFTKREAVFDNKTRLHPTRPYMVYTPDALCRHERRGIDAKAVRMDQRYKWGESLDEIPWHIVAQVWWYMAAMEYDRWDVFALIGGQEPRLYTVERDPEIERVMLEKAEEFYRRYLIGNEQPPIGSSDEASRWLKQQFPAHRAPLRDADEKECALLDAYSVVRTEEEEAAEERKRLEVLVKAAIEDAEGIRWPRGRVTYRKAKDGIETDWEALAIRQMRLMTDAERKIAIAEYSKKKVGSRRFLWSFEEPKLEPPVAPATVEGAAMTSGLQLLLLDPPAQEAAR